MTPGRRYKLAVLALVPLRRSKARKSAESRHGPHRLARVAQCELAWTLRYIHERHTASKAFQHQGTMLHAGMEHTTLDAQAQLQVVPPPTVEGAPLAAPSTEQPRAATIPTPRESIRRALQEYIRSDEDADYVDAATQGVEIFAEAYRDDSFEPLWAEREFEATVDEIDYVHASQTDPVQAVVGREVVTARLDLVCRSRVTGGLWVVDYKSVGRAGTNPRSTPPGRLRGWSENTNEYLIFWQGLMALHVASAHLAREGVLDPLCGFVVRRMTRQPAWDTDEWILRKPLLPYNETPSLIRRCVTREFELKQEHAQGRPAARTGILTGACFNRYGACEYRPACAKDTEAEFSTELDKIAPKNPPVQGKLV